MTRLLHLLTPRLGRVGNEPGNRSAALNDQLSAAEVQPFHGSGLHYLGTTSAK